MSTTSFLGIPSPVSEGGFTPWGETDELISILFPSPSPQNPVCSFSGSGSDEPDRFVISNSASPTTTTATTPSRTSTSIVDQRKKRRMESNRESARRSRMRKQRHLEDLRTQLNRLRIENRELANRLGHATHRGYLYRRDNDRLRTESVFLRRRLSDIRQILIFRQLQPLMMSPPGVVPLQYSTVTSINGQPPPPPSLIA